MNYKVNIQIAPLVTGGLFDEQSGQRAEDKCLNAAAEPVKVKAGQGGDAHSQPGIIGAQIGDDRQHTQHCQHNAKDKG